MGKLFLVRHGKTQYNLDHKFCGLTDIDLVSEGVKNTHKLAICFAGVKFTRVYSSNLKRAIQTAQIILDDLHQTDIKIIVDSRLNERDYGELTGKLHSEVEKFLGEEQINLWRRGWDATPPAGESLQDVYNRAIPFFKDEILPFLTKKNENILITAHGNSLRALIIYLDNLNLDQIVHLEIIYDRPYIYEFDENGMHRVIDKIPREFKIIAR